MKTTLTMTERAASATGHQREAVLRHSAPRGLFTAQHAYAVRLVQIATAISDLSSPAEMEAGNKTATGIVPCVGHENGG
jgi:hypothetical protein